MAGVGADAALEGRLPILPDERLFTSRATLFATCIVFGAAIWIFMIGAGLSALGDVRFTIPGYIVGSTIGYVLVMFGAGVPSFRYGIDAMDVAKASFGTRGALIPLVGLLGVSLAWSAVVTCFIARGTATIARETLSPTVFSEQSAPTLTAGVALAVVVATWALVRRGPTLMERINNIVGPCLLIVATALLVLLGNRIGWNNIWTGRIPTSGWMFPDRSLALISAIELGMGASLGSWPFVAGFTRLVKNRSHVVTPSMLGVPMIGGGYGVAVAALLANALPSTDPVMWFLDLGGTLWGGAAALAVLIGNVAVIGLLIYFAAVAVQQIPWVRRLPWGAVIAVLLVPSAVSAFYADIVLSSVLGVCNYQSLLFVAITGVTLVNYVFVLKGKLDLRSIFAAHGQGAYAGWHGWNISGVVSVIAGTSVYRVLYDPVTLAPGPGFGWVGASVPALLVSAGLFLLLTALIGDAKSRRSAIEISL